MPAKNGCRSMNPKNILEITRSFSSLNLRINRKCITFTHFIAQADGFIVYLLKGKTFMLMNMLTKVFGSKNERELKKLQPAVDRINQLEPEIKALDDCPQTCGISIAS
jgi:hypothetical protein